MSDNNGYKLYHINPPANSEYSRLIEDNSQPLQNYDQTNDETNVGTNFTYPNQDIVSNANQMSHYIPIDDTDQVPVAQPVVDSIIHINPGVDDVGNQYYQAQNNYMPQMYYNPNPMNVYQNPPQYAQTSNFTNTHENHAYLTRAQNQNYEPMRGHAMQVERRDQNAVRRRFKIC